MATIERNRSAERIERDIETLAGSDYTLSDQAIQRTPTPMSTAGRSTTSWGSCRASASRCTKTLWAPSSRATGRVGEPVFGIGSHCDSNRNGGKYDGTMGVVTALEVCRLNERVGCRSS